MPGPGAYHCAVMPSRATKRGSERTALAADCDVLVCGASFAGLAVARTLAGCGRRVLVVDRYAIGERQTSACAIPTRWLTALALEASLLQTFGELVVHTPHGTARWRLPHTFSTFDYPRLCGLLWDQTGLPDAAFETATVTGRSGQTVHTDRGELRAPLVVDALGWRRVLSNDSAIQPPRARLSRGLEVHPSGSGQSMQLWIDDRYVRAGYGWSFPAADEVRVGIGSFWPEHHVKEPTVRLAADLGRQAAGYQGNWIPHQLRDATEDGVFFVGDSAGHCLPLTAEGIRTAFYFAMACGAQLRAVLDGQIDGPTALRQYSAFSAGQRRRYALLLGLQRVIGQLTGTRAVWALVRAMESPRVGDRLLGRYMAAAGPPSTASGRTVPGRDALPATTAA
jgi:flavin-dependent dehydrogenase